MLSVDGINTGDFVSYATIRTDQPLTIGFGVALRRLTPDEITANFSGLPGTVGVPDDALWLATSSANVAVAGAMVLSVFHADEMNPSVILSSLTANSLMPPTDSPGW